MRQACRIGLVFVAGVGIVATPGRAQPCPGQGTNPLQAAITAAQPGDVIVIDATLPNMDTPLCVTKPLTFVGAASLTTVQATSTASASSGMPRGVFYIHSSVAGVVAFQDLQILGMTCYSGPNDVMRGIYSAAAGATVVVDGCVVRGADYQCATGDSFTHGADGIGGALARLIVRDSQVFGGDGDGVDYGMLSCGGIAGSGGDAIDVSGEVLLIRSVLEGGDGGDVSNPTAMGSACCGFPTAAQPGTGGSAAVAPTVWSWSSTGTGGQGGIKYCNGQTISQAANGANLPAGAASVLEEGPHPQLGGTAFVSLAPPPGQNLYALAAGISGWGPTVLVPGVAAPYFLGADPQFVALGFGAATASFSFAVPNSPILLGAMVPIQGVTGATPIATLEFTNPDFVLILP